jgi:hypothetical protein
MRRYALAGVIAAALVSVAACGEGNNAEQNPATEQAVLIHIPLTKDPQDGATLFEIEDRVIEALETSRVGEWDGNEVGPDGAVIYLYGPDADRLFDAVRPALEDGPLPAGSYAVKQYGEPGSRESRVPLK